jgi:hypothetical protein
MAGRSRSRTPGSYRLRPLRGHGWFWARGQGEGSLYSAAYEASFEVHRGRLVVAGRLRLVTLAIARRDLYTNAILPASAPSSYTGCVSRASVGRKVGWCSNALTAL